MIIKDLKDIGVEDRLEYGSKAACLGELMKCGIDVPRGFALSYRVLNEFLEYNNFPYKQLDYLAYNDEIGEFIFKSEFKPDIERAIRANFNNLSRQAHESSYIVRSSSLCEDTDSYSFAGIFQSYGNLNTFEDILAAIKKCYISIFSNKALSYMWSNGIMQNILSMGMIVQEYIPGNISGVAFSADTINMDDGVIHINGVCGSCSGYVDAILPSFLLKVDKASGDIIESHNLPDNLPVSTIFNNRLPEIILKIESTFSCYQDIEWTISDRGLYILQARPITTFRSKNFCLNWNDQRDAEFQWSLGPNIPFQPLILSICPIEENSLDYGILKTGYAYRRSARCIQNGYIYFRNLKMDNWEEVEKKFMSQLHEMFDKGDHIFQDVLLPDLLAIKAQLDNYREKKRTRQMAANFLQTAKEYFIKAWRSHWPAVKGQKYRRVFEEYCKDVVGDIDLNDFYDLVYTPSMATKEREMLVRMAETIVTDDELYGLFNNNNCNEIVYHHLKRISKGIEVLEQIKSYLMVYGMYECGHGEFLCAVLSERPEAVIEKIRPLLKLDLSTFHNSIGKIKENKNKMIELIINKIGENERSEFYKKLRMAEKAFLTGDDHHHYIDCSAWGYLKIAVSEAGRILLNEREIENLSDVLYLTYDELINAILGRLEGLSLIDERKKVFREQKKLLPPQFIGSESNTQDGIGESSNSNTGVEKEFVSILNGIPGLKQKVAGIIHLDIPDHLEEDRILVIWNGHCGDIMHIISRVKGIIFAGGSPFDHLGIIAREMNIPTLYYVEDAYKVLKNGDLVELDGVNGQILIHNQV